MFYLYTNKQPRYTITNENPRPAEPIWSTPWLPCQFLSKQSKQVNIARVATAEEKFKLTWRNQFAVEGATGGTEGGSPSGKGERVVGFKRQALIKPLSGEDSWQGCACRPLVCYVLRLAYYSREAQSGRAFVTSVLSELNSDEAPYWI